MTVRTRIAVCCLAAISAFAASGAAVAQLKIKQGMLNVPALSPLWILPEEAKKQGIEIESVMFQRFADARTALASGDIQLTAFGPQDISLALGAGNKSLVGVAGVGSGNDCLIVRKGEDIKAWKTLSQKRIGVGARSDPHAHKAVTIAMRTSTRGLYPEVIDRAAPPAPNPR